MTEPLRIVQWTAGNVGRHAVAAVADDPRLTYVGAYTRSPDKVGQDLGTSVGLPPLGVSYVGTLAEVLALAPDCVVYMPLHFDVDEVCTLLAGGSNVVTSSEFLSGRRLGPSATERLTAHALAGGATLFGSGMNPGFAQLLAAVTAGMCRRINRVTISESFDLSAFAGDSNMDGLCFGEPVEAPDLTERLQRETAVFGDAIDVLAALLQAEVTEQRFTADIAAANTDLDLPGRPIATGTVAGLDLHWLGLSSERTVIDLHLRWVMGDQITPAMPAESAYTIQIDGEPKVNTRIDILPHQEDWSQLTLDDFHAIGMMITAVPVANAIPAVCAAAPGIAAYADLPVITSSGRFPR